jgi:dimeric dUTPase (all-alpha-NTP-PPase superfamily)
MKQQLITMLELQDAMNSKVNANWREQGNEWYRAIWVECAELMDHYGWKWWKSQTPDLEQVELELIDIWHFGISIELEKSSDYAALAEALLSELVYSPSDLEFREAIEAFALKTLASKAFDVAGFAQLMTLSNLSFDQLFRSYVAKNVLNIFRQDNGYKEGTYRKIWSGREDNEHLMEVLGELSDEQLSMKVLYQQLSDRYSETAS